MNRTTRIVTMPVLVIALTACQSTGSPRATPEPLDPPRVPALDGLDARRATAPLVWWKAFEDPQLDALVEKAWVNNRDLRVAQARLRSAHELARSTRGAFWPRIGAELSAQSERPSTTEGGSRTTTETVSGGGSFAWELDLFGRVRHAVAAAEASADEQDALAQDVRRLAVAHTIETYIDLRASQAAVAVLEAQLANQNETLQLLERRLSAGRASELDLTRYRSQYAATQARLPGLRAAVHTARNRLATLTGVSLDDPLVTGTVARAPLQLPSQLVMDESATHLAGRPDVRAAEAALVATQARHGVARAELFPRISIAGLLALVAAPSKWPGDALTGHTIQGAASWTLFDGGARRARVRSAAADIDAAQVGFERAIAAAVEELDSAIRRWQGARETLGHSVQAHADAEKAARLSRLRYQEGAESLLSVLDADRQLLASQEALERARYDFALATSRSYVALAGGADYASPKRSSPLSDSIPDARPGGHRPTALCRVFCPPKRTHRWS